MIKGTSERDEVRGIPREFVIIHSHVIFIRSLRYESIPRLNSPGWGSGRETWATRLGIFLCLPRYVSPLASVRFSAPLRNTRQPSLRNTRRPSLANTRSK